MMNENKIPIFNVTSKRAHEVGPEWAASLNATASTQSDITEFAERQLSATFQRRQKLVRPPFPTERLQASSKRNLFKFVLSARVSVLKLSEAIEASERGLSEAYELIIIIKGHSDHIQRNLYVTPLETCRGWRKMRQCLPSHCSC